MCKGLIERGFRILFSRQAPISKHCNTTDAREQFMHRRERAKRADFCARYSTRIPPLFLPSFLRSLQLLCPTNLFSIVVERRYILLSTINLLRKIAYRCCCNAPRVRA